MGDTATFMEACPGSTDLKTYTPLVLNTSCCLLDLFNAEHRWYSYFEVIQILSLAFLLYH